MARARIWSIALLLAAPGVGLLAGRAIVGASASQRGHESAYLDVRDETETQTHSHQWRVSISQPDGPPRVETGLVDELGRPITVSCASCHANLPSNPARYSPDDPPMAFHAGLHYEHGSLSCVTCHHPGDYNSLRLADGRSIEYPRVTALCAQCHAPQARDYERGAHGGMTGYWDLSRGPRERKGCIDCHDPHAPRYPSMTPTFKPMDRFLAPREHAEEGGHG